MLKNFQRGLNSHSNKQETKGEFEDDLYQQIKFSTLSITEEVLNQRNVSCLATDEEADKVYDRTCDKRFKLFNTESSTHERMCDTRLVTCSLALNYTQNLD
jgi:hypothetical protein